MYLDPNDSLGLSIFGEWEPYETELIRSRVRRGDVVLDIGANIGYYTLILARLVGDQGHVFAFEPDPENFALLSKNVEINGYRNVTLVKKAVSDRNGKIMLYLSEENRGDHRIYNSADARRSVEIESIRLDDFFKDYDGKIDFIKMDIQGAEAKALEGMRALLHRNPGVEMITELWPLGLVQSGIEPERYVSALVTAGFQIFEIDEQGKGVHKIVDINTLLQSLECPGRDCLSEVTVSNQRTSIKLLSRPHVNLLCLPRESSISH